MVEVFKVKTGFRMVDAVAPKDRRTVNRFIALTDEHIVRVKHDAGWSKFRSMYGEAELADGTFEQFLEPVKEEQVCASIN